MKSAAAVAAALCLVMHQSARSQGPADAVARHRAAYQRIERELKRYRSAQAGREQLGLERRSVEGGWVEAHCDGSAIRKIFAEDDGETSTGTTSFYYDHDSLFFVFIRNGHGQPTATSGPYPKRTQFEEERFYFTDGKLIRWLGYDDKPHDVTTRTAERRGADMLAEGERYQDLMAGCTPERNGSEAGVDEDLSYTLAGIEDAYEKIEDTLPSYRHVQATTDTGSIEGYCEGEALRLLLVDYKSADWTGTDWYYFRNDSLVFVYRTSYPAVAAPQERYYFDDGKLIRWLGYRNAPHEPDSEEARRAARGLIANAKAYRKAIPECRSR